MPSSRKRDYETFRDGIHCTTDAKTDDEVLLRSGKRVGFDEPSSLTRDGFDELCEWCKAIDFLQIFRPSRYLKKGQPIIYRGGFSDLSPLSGCAVCSLFASVLSVAAHWPQRRSRRCHLQLRAFDAARALGLRKPHDEDLRLNNILTVVPLRGGKLRPEEATFSGFILPVSHIHYPEVQGSGAYKLEGRLIEPLEINYREIAEWISQCKHAHPTCQRARSIRPLNCRVIDCQTRKLVPLSENMEYIALSYVCGRSGKEKVQLAYDRYNFPSQTPQTIEDAVTVVKSLGYNFLWVDKYCIYQDDDEDKRTQMATMDQIYANAAVTIVAVAGNQEGFGLHGVSSLPRTRQPRAMTNSGLLVSALPHVSHFIEKSRWARRGWTYQEAILSRRCLFFTEAQAYYVCSGATRRESISQSPMAEFKGRKGPDPLTRLGPKLFMTANFQHFTPNCRRGRPLFFEQLEEYRSRRLGYDSDILNAFKGILARSPWYSYWGQPAISILFRFDTKPDDRTSFNIGFGWSLCWTTGRNSSRRPEFPTWSWTSVVGDLSFGEERLPTGIAFQGGRFCACDQGAAISYVADFWVEVKEGHFSTLFDLTTQVDRKQRVIREYSNALHIDTIYAEVHLKNGTRKRSFKATFARDMPVDWKVDPLGFDAHIDGQHLENVRRKLGKQKWYAILLFQYHSTPFYRGKSNGHSYLAFSWPVEISNPQADPRGTDVSFPQAATWILVDREGDTARRVGIMETKVHKVEKVEKFKDSLDIPTFYTLGDRQRVRLV